MDSSRWKRSVKLYQIKISSQLAIETHRRDIISTIQSTVEDVDGVDSDEGEVKAVHRVSSSPFVWCEQVRHYWERPRGTTPSMLSAVSGGRLDR